MTKHIDAFWFLFTLSFALAGAGAVDAQANTHRAFQARTLEGGVIDQFLEFADERWSATPEGIFRRGFGVWEPLDTPFDGANALLDATPDGGHLYAVERGWQPWGLYTPTFEVEPLVPRLFRSRDGGVTWSAFPLPPGVLRPVDLDVLPGNGRRLWLLDRRLGLFESSSAGTSWRRIEIPLEDTVVGGDEWRQVQIDPHDPERWFVATRLDDYLSDDGGRTWRVTRIGDPTFDPHRPGHAWTVEDGAVMRTRDGGATWRQPLPGRHGRSEQEGRVVISRFDSDWIAIATREGVLVSRDGGANFESLILPEVTPGNRAFVEPTVSTFDRKGRVLIGTGGRGVFRAGVEQALAPLNEGLQASAVSALEIVEIEPTGAPAAEHIFFAQLLDGLYWEPTREPLDLSGRRRVPTLRAYAVDDLAVDPLGTMHALADGVQLSCRPDAPFCDHHEIPFQALEAARQGEPLVYGVTGFDPNGVLRSEDLGAMWELFPTVPGLPPEHRPQTVALAVSPDQGSQVMAWDRDEGGRGFVRFSSDRAETWTTVGEHDMDISSLYVAPGRAERLWAAGNGLFLSDDSGASFAPRGFEGRPVRHVELDPSDIDRAWLLLAQEPGIWQTRNAGLSWSLVEGSETLRMLDLGLGEHGTLYAGGYGGLFDLPFASLPGPAHRLQDRFDVRVGFRDPGTGELRPGLPVEAASLQGDSAAFWFFVPDNVELLIKVLDGRAVNDHFWVFAGVVTDVAYCLEVVDSVTGNTFHHCQDQGEQRSVADIEALPALPIPDDGPGSGGSAGSVAVGRLHESSAGSQLLLEEGQIRAEISVVEPNGTVRQARAVPLTDDAGAFWFFAADNLEVLFKIVDGRAVNGRYWTYWGSLTTLEFTVEVYDSRISESEPAWSYTHPAGPSTSGADVNAF